MAKCSTEHEQFWVVQVPAAELVCMKLLVSCSGMLQQLESAVVKGITGSDEGLEN